ncbi:MAG TPA: hypothetical protein VKK19_00640 [Candidatus Dormibacteraeota bacterium]|nr:hypothetical protein [Candidatus Dormibacteraeota bacterium]
MQYAREERRRPGCRRAAWAFEIRRHFFNSLLCLAAAAALEDAVRASIPQDRRLTWQLTLSWLLAVLVTDSRAASSAIAAW